ncbi:MAG: RNA 3'-terminal phosphate cyclase [Myxococcota bacterium]
MISIDGSEGEGGGQVLRTALALSLVTGKAFQVVNVRARRARPGLMRQHLTAVQAAAEVGHARVVGDTVGSRELSFEPGPVTSGEWTFSVGTAGSATLVLQTILPALLTADGPSKLLMEGGTHNPLAPPFEFLTDAFLPLVGRMGPCVEATLQTRGFYPAGGGRFSVVVQPVRALQPFFLRGRGNLVKRGITVLVSQLPRHVAERETQLLRELLGWEEHELRIESVRNSPGPGNVLLARLEYENVTEVVCAFGEKGVRAEVVAEKLASDVRAYVDAGAPVGEHLADQLMLPLALAGGGGFRTRTLTMHAKTQAELIPRFLDVRVKTTPVEGGLVDVEVVRCEVR